MNGLSAIILAAGKGTRMNSDLPKVAHEVAGKAMVRWVVEACAEVGCERVVVVVGHGAEHVRAVFDDWADQADTALESRATIEFAVQEPQLGTGHAVMCARPLFGEAPRGDVFVLAGDGPLIHASTLATLHERHANARAAATLATAVIDDPTGYGRIVRRGDGAFEAIVEHKNCTPEQRAIHEVNPSYYCFQARALFGALERVKRDEKSGEYYLTDVVGLLAGEGNGGGRVEVVEAVPAADVLSINTPEQLREVDRLLRARLGAAGARGRGG